MLEDREGTRLDRAHCAFLLLGEDEIQKKAKEERMHGLDLDGGGDGIDKL